MNIARIADQLGPKAMYTGLQSALERTLIHHMIR